MLSNKIVYFKKIYNFSIYHFFIGVIFFVFECEKWMKFWFQNLGNGREEKNGRR